MMLVLLASYHFNCLVVYSDLISYSSWVLFAFCCTLSPTLPRQSGGPKRKLVFQVPQRCRLSVGGVVLLVSKTYL